MQIFETPIILITPNSGCSKIEVTSLIFDYYATIHEMSVFNFHKNVFMMCFLYWQWRNFDLLVAGATGRVEMGLLLGF